MNNLIKTTIFVLVAAIASGSVANHTAKAVIFDITAKTKLIIEQGDITQSNVEAIVNAANKELEGGAGVCGAIFKAAGAQQLQAECNTYSVDNGVRCPTGEAKITSSCALEDRGINYIIHAVGPDCRVIKDEIKQDNLLHQAYYNALVLADQNKVTSIAFPFISSAIYAFPKQRAAQIALNAIVGYARSHQATTTISAVHFVLFSVEDYDLFCTMLKKEL